MQGNTEKMGDGRPVNLPGLYRHKESGHELETTSDFEAGKIQADALVQVGYVRVSDSSKPKADEEPAPSKKG